MPGQNIQELGFDLPKFDASKDHVIAGMKEIISQSQAINPELKKVFDSIVGISNTKIQAGSTGGIGELKAQIVAQAKEIENLKKAYEELAVSQQKGNEITKQSATQFRSAAEATGGMLKSLRENVAQQDAYKNKTTEIIDQLRALKIERDNLVKAGGSVFNDEVEAIDKKRLALGEELRSTKELNKEVEKSIALQMQAKDGGGKPIAGKSIGEASLTAEGSVDQVQKYAVAQEQLNTVLATTQIRTTEILAEKKSLEAEYKNVTAQVNANTISVEEGIEKYTSYIAKLAALNQEQQEMKAIQYDTNVALRNMAKEALNAETTLENMKAKVELLKFAYSHLTDEEKKSDFGVALQEKSKALSDAVNEQKKSIGDYTSNVARYAESLGPAFNKVSEEISRLKVKQDELTTSFNNLNEAEQGGPAGAALRTQIESTGRAITDLDGIQKVAMATNQSYGQSISGLEKAFINVVQGGKQSEEFIQEFSQFIIKAKGDMKGLQDQLNVNPKAQNFTNAVNILKTALTDAKARLQQLTEAGKQNTAQGQQAAKEVELLITLVGQQEAGYISLQREVFNTGQQVLELHNAEKTDEIGHVEWLEKLQAEYNKAKRGLNEFNAENRILSSTTPKLAALTAAARGLGGIYAAGAGAASLFAGENEHVQKELNKLVAVMTLLQGLQELNHLVMEKNAIATALFGTATTEATVALEGEAVAATEAGAATGLFGKALAFIEANPIIISLTALAAAVIAIASAFKKEEDQLKKTAEAQTEYSTAVGNVTATIEEQNKLLNKRFELQKQDLAIQLELEKSPEKQLALKNQIANIDAIIAGNNAKSLPNAAKDAETQNAILAKNLILLKSQQKVTEQYTKMQLDGIKEVTIAYTEEEKKAHQAAITRAASFGGGVPELPEKKIKIEDLIEASKKQEEIFKKPVEAAGKSAEELEKIDKDQKEKNAAALKSKQDQELFYADEERKLYLKNAQIEAASVQSKNAIILADEKSTHDQRLAAIRSNAAAAKNLAYAEKVVVTGDETHPKDLTKTHSDQVNAQRDYSAKVIEINKKTNEDLEKENEAYNKRLLAAKYEALKNQVEADANANEEIAKSADQSLNFRLAAYKKYIEDQKTLIEADQRYQILTKEMTDEELTNLDNQTKRKMADLTKKGLKDIKDITESALQERNKDAQTAHDLEVKDITNEFDARQSALTRQFSEGLISQKKYNKETANLQAEKQATLLNYEIYQTQVIIDQQKERLKAVKEEFDAEIEVAKARAELIADPDERQAEFDRISAAKDKEANIELERNNQIAESENKLAALRIKLTDLVSGIIKGDADKTKNYYVDLFKKITEIAGEAFDIIGGFIDASTIKEKNRLQALIDANDAYGQSESERIANSTLSEQDKAAKLIQLKALVDNKDKQLAREQKQRDIEKAKFDKAAAIVKIILNTAVAVTGYLAEQQYAKAIIAGVIGAAELATAIATPIPTYAEGTEDHPGGMARYGEKGPEAIKEPGKPWRIAATDTTSDLAPHTKVVPLTTKDVNDAMYGSMITNTVDRLALIEAIEKRGSNDAWKIAKWQAEQTRQALAANNKKQPVHITNKIDLDHAAWVNKYVFGK